MNEEIKKFPDFVSSTHFGQNDTNYPPRPKTEFDRFELQLTIRFTTRGEPKFTAEEMAAIQNALTYWREGRYSFCSELVEEGLTKAVQATIREIFLERCLKQFGRETIKYADGEDGKAHITAENQAKEFSFVDIDIGRTKTNVRSMTTDEYFQREEQCQD